MGAVQTLTDRRFRRAHVKPSRRRRAAAARRRLVLRIAVLALAGFGAVQLAGTLPTAPFLRVERIVVHGNTRLSAGEVLTMLGGLREQNILTADLAAHRDLLTTSGWIETARLRRVLPSTVEVTVVERVPAVLARFGDRLYLVDREGAVIDEYGPRFAGVDLPIVDGLTVGASGALDVRRARLVSSFVGALSTEPDLLSLVSQVDVVDPYDAVVLLDDEPTLIHLGRERFAERLRQYLELAPALRARVPEIDYVDMRFDRRVVVRAADATGEPPRVAAHRTHMGSVR